MVMLCIKNTLSKIVCISLNTNRQRQLEKQLNYLCLFVFRYRKVNQVVEVRIKMKEIFNFSYDLNCLLIF